MTLTKASERNAIQRTRDVVVTIIDSITADNGRIACVRVKCPWCNGTHQHAWNTGQDFAYPWCGTPGVGYWMQWPEQEPN